MAASPSLERTTILIIGAGPTGLTAALALAQRGITLCIIDQAVQPHGGIRGTAITPRTLELLTLLGAEADVLALNTGPLEMAVYAPSDGREIVKAFKWSQCAEGDGVLYDNIASISQAELEKILRAHLRKYGVEVKMGVRLAGIDQNKNGVTASVVSSADGVQSVIECEYVVAADGGRGSSRRLLGVPFLGETNAAERLWTANVEAPGFSREYWHRWGDFATVGIALKPINPAPLFQMVSLGPQLPQNAPTDLQGLQALFNSISGRDDVIFHKAAWISEWRANIRMAERFAVGRVFLAGDAAHCHSPTGGQGTNTAMQDAFNIAWKLALVVRGQAAPALLLSYEAERMPVVAEMLNLSTALHAKAFNRIPEGAFASARKEEGDQDPMFRAPEVLQLGINYRWSDIVYDERYDSAYAGEEAKKHAYGTQDQGVRAGDRAPVVGDLVCADGQKVDVLGLLRAGGGGHVVFIFVGRNGTREEGELVKKLVGKGVRVVRILPVGSEAGDGDVVDASGVAQKVYIGDDPRAVYAVVRPDGIIGSYTYGWYGVEEYFRRID